jgi:hypothetical protein
MRRLVEGTKLYEFHSVQYQTLKFVRMLTSYPKQNYAVNRTFGPDTLINFSKYMRSTMRLFREIQDNAVSKRQ